jgi:hypothetical protein
MNKYINSIILILCVSHLNAQQFKWLQYLDNNHNSSVVLDKICDTIGNVFICGTFINSINLNSIGTPLIITSTGSNQNGYLAKYDSLGNLKWYYHIAGSGTIFNNRSSGISFSTGGNNDDNYNYLALDYSDNIYFVGQFIDSIKMGYPIVNNLHVTSNQAILPNKQNDIFILKLNKNGKFQDVHYFNSTGIGNIGIQLANIQLNKIYCTIGAFNKNTSTNITFKKPQGIIIDTISKFTSSIFVLDTNLNLQWKTNLQGCNVGSNNISALDVDNDGNVLAAGWFFDSLNIFSSTSNFIKINTSLNNQFNKDGFVLKLDDMGLPKWATSFGGKNYDGANTICHDASNNVYFGGYFKDTVDFDPSSNIFSLNALPNYDFGFITKFTPNGLFLNSYSFEGYSTQVKQIKIDKNNNIYLGLFTNKIADADPLSSQFFIKNKFRPSYFNFVCKYNSNLNIEWGSAFTSNLTSEYSKFAIDNKNNFYQGGYIDFDASIGTEIPFVDFDPDTTNVIKNGYFSSNEGFLVKYSECKVPKDTLNIACCNVFSSVNNNLYNTTGNYWENSYNGNSCNKMTLLNLNIGHTINTFALDTACKYYSLPNGTIINQDTVYSDTFATSQFCDSIVSHLITIKRIDIKIIRNNNLLQAQNLNANNYQWYDCYNESIINGETNPTFKINNAGSFALIISENGCIDTSQCFFPMNVSHSNIYSLDYKINPIPTKNKKTSILFSENINQIELQLFDLQGNFLQKLIKKNVSEIELDLNYTEGTYFLKSISEKGIYFDKIIID